MTSRTKIIVGLCAVASIALFTGVATFDQWSGFVLRLIVPVTP
jgi:hypothetical protein